MALTRCPECGGKVSDRARSCPHCGYPFAPEPYKKSAAVKDRDASFKKAVRIVGWANMALWLLFMIYFCALGIGFILSFLVTCLFFVIGAGALISGYDL